LSGQGDIAITT